MVVAVTVHPRFDGNVRVVLSDGTTLLADAVLAERAAIRRGVPTGGAAWAAFCRDVARHRAHQDGLRLLGVQSRSVADLRCKLVGRGHTEAAVAAAIAALQERGVLDDEAFAAAYVQHRLQSGQWGAHRLRADLRRRGVPPPVIEAVLQRCLPTVDPVTAALALSRARWPRLQKAGPAAGVRRLTAYLQRRGFDSETIHRTVRRLLGPGGDDWEVEHK